MSDEKEKAGQCGWVAFGFFIFFLQGFLSLGISGGMNAIKISESLVGNFGTTDLLGRLIVLMGIVSGLLLSAVSSMIFAMGLVSAFAKISRRIKNSLPRARVPFMAE